MAVEAMIFKAESVAQASKLSAAAGKTFTVGKVAAAGNGMGKWLVLDPIAGAGKSSIAVKLEGTRQISQLSGLAGKTVTVGKAQVVAEGAGKWIVLNPATGGAAKTAAGSGILKSAAGKSVGTTVTKSAIAVGKTSAGASALAGKTAAAGTIWKGTGLSLGLGLGLGALGPIILLGVVSATVYGYMKSQTPDVVEERAS